MKKKHEAEKENGERWLLTYADLITLLMVFFVVMYAMSNVDKAKFEAIAESMSAAFASTVSEDTMGKGPGEGKVITEKSVPKPAVPLQSKKARSPVYDKAYDILKTQVESNKVKLRQEERGLVVQLGGEFFFEPGSAKLPQEASSVLIDIASMVSGMPNEIQVEGYADSSHVDAKSGFASNWELSAQRAINVKSALADYGVSESRLSIAAYGAQHSGMSNETAEERAFNRRVNIVILRAPDDYK